MAAFAVSPQLVAGKFVKFCFEDEFGTWDFLKSDAYWLIATPTEFLYNMSSGMNNMTLYLNLQHRPKSRRLQ